MTTTIKVDGTVADFTWQDDELLDPAADVDIVIFPDDSMAKGYPTSSAPTPTPAATLVQPTQSPGGGAASGSGSLGAPLTVSVTKAATSRADETVEVTFAGGPSVKEQVVTWSFTSSAGQTPQNPVTIPIAHTAESAAKLLQQAETDTDLTSAVNGAVVTFTPKSGESITGLNISIS